MAKKKKETVPTNEAPPAVETPAPEAHRSSTTPFDGGFRAKLIQTKEGPGVIACEMPKGGISLMSLANGSILTLSREGARAVAQLLNEWAYEQPFVMVARWEYHPDSLSLAVAK